jgi:4-hydroxy-2-oxoheptanedioate aldolase
LNRCAKDRIGAGRAVVAVNPGGVALPVVEAAAALGAGVLFIDCERTAISVESVPALARTAQALGMSALVRSPSHDPALLTRYLDCGVDGLILPAVESAAVCAMLLDTAATAAGRRAADLLLVAQIESVPGLERWDEIAAAPGIDLVLIGPNDLSHSMGFRGDTGRPEVVEAVAALAARLRAKGRAFGLPVTPDSAADWVSRGATFLYTTLQTLLAPGLGAVGRAAA